MAACRVESDAIRIVFGLTDSGFIMGSMGSVVGEKLTRAIEEASLRISRYMLVQATFNLCFGLVFAIGSLPGALIWLFYSFAPSSRAAQHGAL